MRTEDSRERLVAGVRDRREEILATIIARAHAIDTAGVDADHEYREGLRQAVETAIDHTIQASEPAADRANPVPAPIIAQARLAARRRVPLEVMLRRYLAGHSALSDVVAEEAERKKVKPAVLRQVLRSQAARTDSVLALITEEYVRETNASHPKTSDQRSVERVRELLDGGLGDPAALAYKFDRWHIALVACGPERRKAVDALLARSGGSRLVVPVDDDTVWAWIGSDEDPTAVRFELPARYKVNLAVGAPGRNLEGWRLTHQQAQAALPVARRSNDMLLHYSDVALIACVMQDELTVTSLRQLLMEPLRRQRDGGRSYRETLRTFFATEQNITSTAAALGVNRNTVTNRLRGVEERVGRSLAACSAELAVALRLEELSP